MFLTILPRLAWMYRAESVHMAVWIGLGGLAFVVGNLLLAGTLGTGDFGQLALFEAILGIGVYLAPLGLDSLVVRRELDVRPAALWRASSVSVLVGTLAGLAAVAVFDFSSLSVLFIGSAIVSAATLRMCAAAEQSAVRLQRSQFLTQMPNLWFGAGGLALACADVSDWNAAAGVLSAGFLVSALAGLGMLRLGSRDWVQASALATMNWRLWGKAMSFVGLLASVLILHHIERLIIPHFLGFEELATFAVVATVVASPFRILQDGVGYSLMPRIRAEPTVAGRRHLVRIELARAGILGLAGGVVLVILAPTVVDTLYGEKYTASLTLVIAMVMVGLVRLAYAVASASVRALSDSRHLRWFSWLAWVGTVVAALAAILLSVFGLVGVVAGSALGWLVRLAAATVLLRPALAIPPRETLGADSTAQD